MARLHEYQGKALLKQRGIHVPDGQAITTPQQAHVVAAELGGRVVLKVQAWITGRKARGGVLFADTPDEAKAHAETLRAMRFGNFPVSEVLVAVKDAKGGKKCRFAKRPSKISRNCSLPTFSTKKIPTSSSSISSSSFSFPSSLKP